MNQMDITKGFVIVVVDIKYKYVNVLDVKETKYIEIEAVDADNQSEICLKCSQHQ